MHAVAIGWAEAVLGRAVVQVEPLAGGITSTMLALTDDAGRESVLRLMTNEPWRSHGAELVRREQRAQTVLGPTPVRAPSSLGLDPEGMVTGHPVHLMSRLPGAPRDVLDPAALQTMAETLRSIHAVEPAEPFRQYQSWAGEPPWAVPTWSRHPTSWRRAFDALAEAPPDHTPVLLHRDFSHRNLLWSDGAISGVVDWVETSSGPAWLDAGHAATNLAMAVGTGAAASFLTAYAEVSCSAPTTYWLLLDAVGFLPPPGRPPTFGTPEELRGLDEWVHRLTSPAGPP